MSTSTKTFAPASLLKCFDPPEEFTGEIGWLCGYSADAGFLDAAVQRFTLETPAQRSHVGRIALLALLDPGQSQIRPEEAPGVLHAPLLDLANKPFALLHAKVALLLFRHQSEGGRWTLRLVVSTGNWTRQTLEESLDLVWAAQLDSEQSQVSDESCLQVRADIRDAWDMMNWLVGLFDISAITSMPNGRSALLYERMREVCGKITAPRRMPARFFHSRAKGLLRQLPALVRHHAGPVRRNSIFFGSGFYEGSTDGQVPSVLEEILRELRTKSNDAGPLLTDRSSIYVIAEPTGCQAVSSGLQAMRELDWWVGPPYKPDYLGSGSRTLHAKFILSANDHSSDNCVSNWIYLGSGNLTHPGFVQPMSPTGGNLEAGVVFSDDSLKWYLPPKSPETWVKNRLPIQFEENEQFGENGLPLPVAGDGMPERPPAFDAPPVAWCRYEPGPPLARLVLPPDEAMAVTVLDTEGHSCDRISSTEVAWPSAPPRSVQVRWQRDGTSMSAFIPVLDAAGRVAGASLPALDMDGAWWQLERFPLPPLPEEDTRLSFVQGSGQTADTPATPQAVKEQETAVRVMMRLLENVADKQTALSEADWPAWCASLQQTLLQAKGSPAVKAFVQWRVNPLSALRAAPFRPRFSEDPTSRHSDRYEQALNTIEEAWGVDGCDPLARKARP